ncbi:MAG: asparagine synthase (glutamine-hydrolyzing) [Alphaproteobacteria bacterium]|nr:asparagine synthase (glutamine-hydrolyzing) [Alphaproteobacteria bacterium]
MCGIAGVSLKKGQHAKPEHLAPLAAALAHRGPDGEGFWYQSSVGLAHRRLSIIDVAGGKQPLTTPTHALVVNGELYNYKPLQAALRRAGAELQTDSDSEVALHLAVQHGLKAMPSHLQGMYALACAEADSGMLLLATDPFGIKPLYYCQTNVGLAFASEPAALAKAGWVRPQLNAAVLPMLLNRHYSVGSATLWQGLQRLLPGERLLVQHGEIVERWRQLPTLPAANPALNPADFPAQLEAAVARHLQADVPLGLLLSGGLDSSALAVMMRQLGTPVHAYTARIEVANGPNEADRAAALCQALGATHTVVPYTAEDFWPGLATLAAGLDDLTTDTAALPLFKLTARARQDVKILLSGEGGDETLAGYGHYRARQNFWKRLVAPFKARRQGDAAPFAALFRQPLATPPYQAAAWDDRGFTPLQRKQSTDLANWLPHDLLLKLDRTTMANGVEGRVPYLDDTLAAFSFALPDAAKVNADYGKLPLRQFLAAQGFDQPAWARKQGFSVGVGQFLQAKPQLLHGLWAQSAVLNDLLQPTAAAKLLGNLRHNKTANLATSLTLLALWEAHHLRGTPLAELQERLGGSAW